VTKSVSIDRDHVVRAIEDKVARYRHIVEETGLAFMVILAGERRTGLNEAFVSDVLNGRNVLTISFDAWTLGPMSSRKQTLRRSDEPPEFHPALSAVAYRDVRDGHDAELVIWRIKGARHTLPALPTSPRKRIRLAATA
jgi:hypothetical protein